MKPKIFRLWAYHHEWQYAGFNVDTLPHVPDALELRRLRRQQRKAQRRLRRKLKAKIARKLA